MRLTNFGFVQMVTLWILSNDINPYQTFFCNSFSISIAPTRYMEKPVPLTQRRMNHLIKDRMDNEDDDNGLTRRLFVSNTAIIATSATIASLLGTRSPAFASGGATAGRYTYVCPFSI
jgi:hypothetical protein